MNRELYDAITRAQVAAQKAYELSFPAGADFATRRRLGRAQCILIRLQAKHAGQIEETGRPVPDDARSQKCLM